MALVNPNIAMSFRQPEFTPRNALAEYAQIQQIQGGQRQAEVADMQLRRMRQEDEDIERIHQIAMKNGGPDSRMEMGRALFASRNPTQRELGYKILQHEEAVRAYNSEFGPRAMAAPAMPSSAPNVMVAPEGELVAAPITAPKGTMREIAPGGAMGAEMPLAQANTLAPPAAAPVNAMLAAQPTAPTAPNIDALRRQYSMAVAAGRADAPVLLEQVKAALRGDQNRPMAVSPGQVVIDPITRQPIFTAPDKPAAATSLSRLIAERDALPPNSPVRAQYDAAIKKETTQAPGTTVNVSTEKKYGERFGGLIAERDATKLDVAEAAPQLAESANRIIGLVQQGNVFTGPIADVKLNIARALNVAGANNQEKIANTESLIAATGKSTLDAIKGAGLGTGQGFTNKDLTFLQGIAGGTINLTSQTLTELARLQHLVATRSAEAWNKRSREIPREVLQGAGLSATPITVPPLAAVKKGATTRPAGVGDNWTLERDAAGNTAWVSPDRKSFKEVK